MPNMQPQHALTLGNNVSARMPSVTICPVLFVVVKLDSSIRYDNATDVTDVLYKTVDGNGDPCDPSIYLSARIRARLERDRYMQENPDATLHLPGTRVIKFVDPNTSEVGMAAMAGYTNDPNNVQDEEIDDAITEGMLDAPNYSLPDESEYP